MASLQEDFGVDAHELQPYLPADPARMYAGPSATVETVARIRHELGLDQPLWVQFWRYLVKILQLDLGYSLRFRAPVLELIAGRLPIIADSVPELEWKETEAKARALVRAAELMNPIFWKQWYGDRDALLERLLAALDEGGIHEIETELCAFDERARKAAEQLGLSRSAFYRRLERYKL